MIVSDAIGFQRRTSKELWKILHRPAPWINLNQNHLYCWAKSFCDEANNLFCCIFLKLKPWHSSQELIELARDLQRHGEWSKKNTLLYFPVAKPQGLRCNRISISVGECCSTRFWAATKVKEYEAAHCIKILHWIFSKVTGCRLSWDFIATSQISGTSLRNATVEKHCMKVSCHIKLPLQKLFYFFFTSFTLQISKWHAKTRKMSTIRRETGESILVRDLLVVISYLSLSKWASKVY